jgi:hypothetical protein
VQVALEQPRWTVAISVSLRMSLGRPSSTNGAIQRTSTPSSR